MKTDILIIGGGLAGLNLAAKLQAAGRDFTLVEARQRLGGRIFGAEALSTLDLGPAWFWPGQPRMAQLVTRLGLQVFEQHYAGDLSFENSNGQVERGRGFSSMQGSYRLRGGFRALIQALAAEIDSARLLLGDGVTSLSAQDQRIAAITTSGQIFEAHHVVLALPPRLAAHAIAFDTLPEAAMAQMQAIPTWMAGQAKAIACYDTAFWRTAGLSGDAMSRHGPMVEIHDASGPNAGPYALFGFIGVPPAARQDEAGLRRAVLDQLARIFGAEAANPTDLFIKDWAFDAKTATPLDHAPLTQHPSYGMPLALSGLWNGKLHFAGSETARTFGGFLEGALEASEAVASNILAD